MIKIGIGVTTYNRPECLQECLDNILKYTDMGNVNLYIATDTDEDRRGVAYRKNECLRALKDCDYVFLFDDDCFPIKDGWVDFFIKSDVDHLIFCDKKLHALKNSRNGLSLYRDCGGVFMFMTKNVIKMVGAFDENYSPWGLEHADYSNRVYGYRNNYLCLSDTNKYLFAHDYSDNPIKSSVSNEEKNLLFKKNFPKYLESIKQIYIPL